MIKIGEQILILRREDLMERYQSRWITDIEPYMFYTSMKDIDKAEIVLLVDTDLNTFVLKNRNGEQGTLYKHQPARVEIE